MRVSAEAAADPSLVTVLPSLLYRNVGTFDDVRSLRIGLPGLGSDALVSQALADVLDIEIVAPESDFCATPGAALYAGGGWRRFRPGSPSTPGGLRYPEPRWEAALRQAPGTVGRAVLEPVPAGLFIRGIAAPPPSPDHAAFVVPVDFAAARIVVGGDGRAPKPAAVAEVLGRLPGVPVQLVVLSSAARTHAWLHDLAKLVGSDVVVAAAPSANGRAGLFPPFVSLLRQRVDGSQEVVEAAPPPARWLRRDSTGYCFGTVQADVVPSGVALHTGPADPVTAEPPVDPRGWTLHLGTPGEPIGPELLTAAEALLAGLDEVVRDAAELRLVGVLDDRVRQLIGVVPRTVQVHPSGAPVEKPAPADRQPVRDGEHQPPAQLTQGVHPVPATQEPPSAHGDNPRQEPAPGENSGFVVPSRTPRPMTPPSLLVSGPSMPTKPEEPVARRESEGPLSSSQTIPGPAASRAVEPAKPAAEDVTPERPKEPGKPAPAAPQANPPAHEVAPVKPLAVADRPSTAAEQARFTAAVGEAYGEALATVNAALATWPSMRRDEAGAKADYVAVCLYLGQSVGSSADFAAAVRGRHDGQLDGQVACLVSGLRRLPVHRRAVLRQIKTGQSPEATAEPGAVLAEPGFLCGSIDLDVTVPGANLDVLIWPASARRTSELRIGQAVNEAVFSAGARFKALALREADPAEEPVDGGVAAPRVAALFRELAPGEAVSTSGELDDNDIAVLAKLEQALERRHR
ncbi:MAG TPA: hypothetical protein VG497_06850, partial [Kribbella sp.]|nr:hypothetical protein [Kribbella sp.]